MQELKDQREISSDPTILSRDYSLILLKRFESVFLVIVVQERPLPVKYFLIGLL